MSLQARVSTLGPRHTKDAEPSRSPPCGFTPPINFTAGTLNFIGNVNLVVKNTDTHTHTHGQWLEEAVSKGRRHPELSKDSGKYKRKNKDRMKGLLFGRNIVFKERGKISHQLRWDTATPKI